MIRISIDSLYFIGVLLIWDLMVVLGYIFPHFSMHLFASNFMPLNDSYFNGKCDHTKEEILEYKAKQKIIVILSLIISFFIIIMLGIFL